MESPQPAGGLKGPDPSQLKRGRMERRVHVWRGMTARKNRVSSPVLDGSSHLSGPQGPKPRDWDSGWERTARK